MPRTPRKLSESGIYHVMLRGIDRIQLFYDDDDHRAFLERLAHNKDRYGYSLLAYALMGNHVHLLIQEGRSGISSEIKSIATSYAHWHNNRYERSGYLFQGRFKSEAITGDAHLLAALRYILNNPVKIGLPINYWTSYNDYMSSANKENTLTDTTFVLKMFSERPDEAKRLLAEFLTDAVDEKLAFIEDEQKVRHKDADAIEIIKELAQVRYCGEVASMDRNDRDLALAMCKERRLSVRQLSRLTGVNRNIVQRASL